MICPDNNKGAPMTKGLLVLVFSFFLSPSLFAQEFGALAGVHQTTADAESSGTSIDGKFNFKAGMVVAFELTDRSKFRTGLLYTQRHVESTAGGGASDVNFDYFDVPALVQYNANDMFGFFGGLIVGINVNDDIKRPAGVTATDPDAEKLIPLMSLGVNMTFQDMIGFDVYYERGLGGISDGLENFSTFGANFLFWF